MLAFAVAVRHIEFFGRRSGLSIPGQISPTGSIWLSSKPNEKEVESVSVAIVSSRLRVWLASTLASMAQALA